MRARHLIELGLFYAGFLALFWAAWVMTPA